MPLYLGVLILSFILTLVSCIPFIDFLYKNRFIRKKETEEKRTNGTKEFKLIRAKHAHKAGTPTGLGLLLLMLIPLLFGALFPLLVPHQSSNLFSNFPIRMELIVIFTTFFGFGLIGLYDDLVKVFGYSVTLHFGLRRRRKFALQCLVALIVSSELYWGLGINFLHIPILGTLYLGWLYLPLTALLIATFANAFDITSGLDGLGEGLLIICLFAFLLIAYTRLDHVSLLFIAIWLGALIGVTYFTVHPARAFLGNASGLAFGSTLAILGLISGKIFPLLIVGGIFMIEIGSSFLQIVGKNIFKKRIFPIAPIHHWLELIGWEESKIVIRTWLAGLILAILGLCLALM
ncbi:hypothetical protein HYU91_01105 [Candidatus Collierbacteria bacterium]|nr:hypothetical protein [Candidatus Collierbacteria bacterium]